MYEKKKSISVSMFSNIWPTIWKKKISILPPPVDLLKVMLNYFAQVIFKGENSANMML